MKKLLELLTFGTIVLIIIGCSMKEKEDKAVIRRNGGGLSVITCYQDSKGNKKCIGEDIGLYVEYKNKKLTIDDALKQNLITLDDIEQAYNKFSSEHYYVKKKLIDDKTFEELMTTTEIIVEENSSSKVIKKITNKKEIENIINILYKYEGLSKSDITIMEKNKWILSMYNSDDKLTYLIDLWEDGYIGTYREYSLDLNGREQLLNIIEN